MRFNPHLRATDDGDAKSRVTALLGTLGWPNDNVIDAGGIAKSRLLEPLCMLYCDYAIDHDDWDIAFKILRKPKA